MKRSLNDILKNLNHEVVSGHLEISVHDLVFDSRKVSKGACFFAIRGTQTDGHEYISKAIESGANTIVCETIPEQFIQDVTYVKVADAAEAMGVMASAFYEHPSRKLKLVGVTGTNGKTTTVTLLHQLFSKLGYRVGLISTVVNKIENTEVPSTHTTPDSVSINQLLDKMLAEGCTHCFMEVSSHAVVQQRASGLHFSGGVFTNISHDHLDYHKTFSEYIKAKRGFFNLLPADAFALSNRDDKNGEVMLQETKASKSYYALKTEADFKAKIIENTFEGLSLKLNGHELWSTFIGKFNAYNLSAVYGAAILLGEEEIEVLTQISSLEQVSGRFQYLKRANRTAIVDYAHTPDALENVLNTIKGIRTGNEKVITVVGCGGDRDTTKRPIMADIATSLSDKVVLTSDNPRTENPDQIIHEMKAGISAERKAKALSITNRREAIRTATAISEGGDIILIAGKGHETYQEVNGERNHFDDLEEIQKALNELLNQ